MIARRPLWPTGLLSGWPVWLAWMIYRTDARRNNIIYRWPGDRGWNRNCRLLGRYTKCFRIENDSFWNWLDWVAGVRGNFFLGRFGLTGGWAGGGGGGVRGLRPQLLVVLHYVLLSRPHSFNQKTLKSRDEQVQLFYCTVPYSNNMWIGKKMRQRN